MMLGPAAILASGQFERACNWTAVLVQSVQLCKVALLLYNWTAIALQTAATLDICNISDGTFYRP